MQFATCFQQPKKLFVFGNHISGFTFKELVSGGILHLKSEFYHKIKL